MFPLKDTIQSRTVPFVTWLLILCNGLVFLYETSLSPRELEFFVAWFGMIPARLSADPSSAYTLLTSTFLHGSWLHLVSNMWALYLFGDNVEDQMGPVRFLLFYLVCGMISGVAQYAVGPTQMVPAIGASGAVAAVCGAYILLYPHARVITLVILVIFPFFVEIPAVVLLGLWFLSQLFSGAVSILDERMGGNIAWWAHIGGFVAGMLLVWLFRKSKAARARLYDDEYWPW